MLVTGHETWVRLATLPNDFFFSREEGKLGVEEFSSVIRRSTLIRPVDEPVRIATMLERADLLVTVRAKKDRKLIGVARSLSDFSWCCYLSDLCVDEDYQGRGIGRALIAKTKRIVGSDTTLLLVSAPKAINFYNRIGMEALPATFAIRRDPNPVA